jgi:DNA processing protein
MHKNIPNGWDLESVIALTYKTKMSYNIQRNAIENYSNYDEFAKNAKILVQEEMFNADAATIRNDFANARKQIELANDHGCNIVTLWDDKYPALLKEIYNPPIILFVRGNLQPAEALSISVVGTRRNTQYGKLVTENYVKEFVSHNILITSGMANGIDSIAHNTAVNNGGITYAVIASGLDKMNVSSKHFADTIVASGGAIISEYKFGTAALQGYFLQRNRIISGISKATLVVESAIKGGSLNTARNALDQNREVYAVPGSVLSERSYGCNYLISKNKAAIALSPKFILSELISLKIDYDEDAAQSTSIPKIFNSKEEELLYNVMSADATMPTHIDDLPAITNLDISAISVLLLDMEFDDKVKQLPGKYYIKI